MRPDVQPIFQIEQPPERVHQKTPAPIRDCPLRSRSVLAHPSCHFRVVCPARDEFAQCLRVDSTGSKELAIHRAVVNDTRRSRRRVLRGIYLPRAQPRLESCRTQLAGCGERPAPGRAQAHEDFPHSRSAQISSCFGNRDRILQPVFVTKTTSSIRTPPSPG
jgi:hypothetical protein